MTENNQFIPADSYKSATGTIRFTFLNDAMFKINFQKSDILKSFLCALLKCNPEDITDIQINNTFIPGKFADDKAYLLDIDLLLNTNTKINLELQVADQGNWKDRSLHYLCRNYDQLHRGEDYSETKMALHIGILDFNLFPDYPEFYASYQLLHTKKHYIYNDKLRLNVLSLNQIALATKEDKAYRLDEWAALFKATTWEEIKMLAEKNKTYANLAQNLYESNSDEIIRYICQKREDNARQERWLLKRVADAEAKAEEAVAKAEADVIRATKAATEAATEAAAKATAEAIAEAIAEATAEATAEIAALKARIAELESTQK